MKTILPRMISLEKRNKTKKQKKTKTTKKHCKLCNETENIITLTEEDLCPPCQEIGELDDFCPECYKKRIKFKVCILCCKLFRKVRDLPATIELKLQHPDNIRTKCSICNVKTDDVMYRTTDKFCVSCLALQKEKYRYMCDFCYHIYAEKYGSCFYCHDVIFANPIRSELSK